ncbi:alcohol acetyltransferase-domain-containing protein [Cladorrhinum sp. PSN332]|nr:alcohol acetyltransferase-domain-containing protein [Cladorrhinum sp. PSN332]
MQITSAGGRAIRPLGPRYGIYQPLRQVLQTAIANVVLDLPSLGVGIVGEDTSKPHFVALPAVRLDHHFELLVLEASNQDRDDELLRILESQHDRPWPDIATRPPWKATALSYPPGSLDTLTLDIVFAVHHSIADGRSTAAFHTKFLSELLAVTERPVQLSNHTLSLATDRRFSPPLEEAIKFKQSWAFLLSILWRELGPAWLQGQKPATPWTGNPISREPCKTNLQLVVVPATAAKQVLAACRQHQTTLTPLLHALTLISLARHVPAEDAEAFSSSTPIDLRPFMERDVLYQAQNTFPFGVFVTAQGHRFELSTLTALRDSNAKGCSVWEIASELRRDMKKHIEGVPGDDIMSMLSWVSDWEKFWLTKLGKPRQTTWEVSNLGTMVGSSEDASDSWRIKRSIMLAQPFGASNGSSISIQTRAKSNVMRPRDQGVVVRLLEDIPKFGRKSAIFRIERGRMRNHWFPNKKAEYMTAERFQQLGLSRKTDVGERDPSFGSVAMTEQYEPEQPQFAPEPKSSLATSAEKSHTLLSILIPETLTFYRKPNPATSSTAAPSGANAPLAIFGSVSISDVINHIKGLLALDEEGSRVALEPAHIQFRGLEEDTDRIKTLGRFEAHLSLDSSKEPVVKVIEVLPTNE